MILHQPFDGLSISFLYAFESKACDELVLKVRIIPSQIEKSRLGRYLKGINEVIKVWIIPSQIEKSCLGRYLKGINEVIKVWIIPSQIEKSRLGRYLKGIMKCSRYGSYRPKSKNRVWDGI